MASCSFIYINFKNGDLSIFNSWDHFLISGALFDRFLFYVDVFHDSDNMMQFWLYLIIFSIENIKILILLVFLAGFLHLG